MIPTSIAFRTIHIAYKTSTGTCFVLDYDNKEYYITAKHVVDGLKTDESIHIFFDKKWNEFNIKLVGHSDASDISVFVVPDLKFGGDSMKASSNRIYYGQEIFFLGFPYNIQHRLPSREAAPPMPFVKKGILSNFHITKQFKVLYLDGINNPGFSGGPIVYYNVKEKSFELCGIISGFRYEKQYATFKESSTELEVKLNTGIIIGYSIEAALELIKQNPIGVKF